MNGIFGDFDRFSQAFPNDLIPHVVQLMLREWPQFQRPVDNVFENSITNRFVGHLKKLMRIESYPFNLDYRPKVAAHDSDSESGELDISVRSYQQHPDAVFIIECKRLNVENNGKFSSNAGKYVGSEGMGCFISEQYRSGGDIGGMLGYVMTRTIEEAISSINSQLAKHHKQLCLANPHTLNDSPKFPRHSQVKKTCHKLASRDFEIIHMFVLFKLDDS